MAPAPSCDPRAPSPSAGAAAVTSKADLDALYAALDAADEEAPDAALALAAWHARAAGSGTAAEVVLEEDVVDAHRGKRLTNRGSPLYIAVVRDQALAVGLLQRLGADPNYVHPEHGDGPLLHAAENGYDDCLRVLLSSHVTKPAEIFTVDRKIFLGQGLPQYQEGGLSALQLAARSGRTSTVTLLLENRAVLHQLLHRRDSFGRTPLQAALDALGAACPLKAAARGRLEEVVRALCGAAGVDAEEALETRVPSREEALEAAGERQRRLRARCLQVEQERREAARRRGLEAIAAGYRPLHPAAYAPSGAPLPVAGGGEPDVQEPHPGVFAFPLLPEDFCRLLWEEVHHYERAAVADRGADLPLHVRHDGNIGDLQDCGFAPTFRALEGVLGPVLARCMPDLGAFEIHHAFLTRNYVGRAENATFKVHCDKSDLTINICLHASADVQGSTVGFYDSLGPGEVPMEPRDRRYTYVHRVGHAVVHDGRQWHKTDPITQGTRGSLIAWARVLPENRERPPVGALVRLAARPRTSEGVLAGGAIGVLVEDDGVSRQPFKVAALDGGASSWYHPHDLVTAPAASDAAAL